jgi:hypothetical protein
MSEFLLPGLVEEDGDQMKELLIYFAFVECAITWLRLE